MDIKGYLEQRGHRWQRVGSNYVTNCPINPDSKPSFTLYPDGHWKCYSCLERGDGPRLVAYLEFPGFVESDWREILAYCEKIGIRKASTGQTAPPRGVSQEEAAVLKVAYEHFRQQLHLNPAALWYLAERGIRSPASLPIGYCPEDNRSLALLGPKLRQAVGKNWLKIGKDLMLFRDKGRPIYRRLFIAEMRQGEVAYYQLRSLTNDLPRYINPPKHIFSKHLFGLESLANPTPVFLVEGVFDALPLIERGAAAVALLGLTSPEMDRLFPLLMGRSVAVATDWEDKGEAAAQNIIAVMRARGITAFRLHKYDGCGDLGDWAAKYPQSCWRELLTQCPQYDTVSA